MYFYFFFNDTATTEIYTLSLHDALPISQNLDSIFTVDKKRKEGQQFIVEADELVPDIHATAQCILVRFECLRSEEHTSELQSQFHLVCRLLLEKKKKKIRLRVT